MPTGLAGDILVIASRSWKVTAPGTMRAEGSSGSWVWRMGELVVALPEIYHMEIRLWPVGILILEHVLRFIVFRGGKFANKLNVPF